MQEFGAAALVRALADQGLIVHQTTPQRWADRDSIPGEYWGQLVELKAATLEELAQAAERRRFPPRTGAPEALAS